MRFPFKAAATVVSVSALAMANLPTSIAAPEQNFNGKDTCITIDGEGNVVAPQPGDCTQFGKGGQGNSDAQARNVIFILGDGMGHQEITAARNYLKGANGRFEGLDELTASGAYTTFAVGGDGKRQYVTDSAASATGWSTGAKTYNGALSVDITGKAHENLLEMAKNAGMRTGNVSTAEIQDATPGAMHSHISQRGYYAPSGEKKVVKGAEARENGGLGSISEQIIDTRADVTLGGGRKYFDTEVQAGGENRNPFLTEKNDGGAEWEAGKTVRDNAVAKGFQVVDDQAGLDGITKADQNSPVLGLFNDGNMTRRYNQTVPGHAEDMQPETCLAQDTGNEPTAAAMTRKAIELLDDPSADKGFFLQVESASIDKADHAADACGLIGETEQIDEVIKEALDFAKKDKNTLIVVTADHAHTAEIVPDGKPSVSPVTRLKSPKDGGAVMSVAFGTVPWEKFESGNFSMQHTGTQVRIAGYGPGSENLNGQLDQTDAFYVMANALRLNGGTPGGQQPWEIAKGNKVQSLANRRQAKPGNELCYLVSAGTAPKVGECSQFGAQGQELDKSKAKNVVLLIGDGTGDSEITAARNYLKGSAGRFEGLDNLDYTGYLTTFALDKETGLPNYVTDSAASGTAWNSGVKTYNGAIGVDNAGKPVATIGELAKAKGMKIGNVTTAEIQDATPAAFAAHALNRSYYAPSGDLKPAKGEQLRENGGLGSISEQIVDLRADVTLGGGRKYFDAEVKQGGQWGENGNTWTAGKSVLDNAKDNGYQVVTNASELNAIAEANADKPVLGLFSGGNMPRVLNQSIPTTDGGDQAPATCVANPEFTAETPRLSAMTTKALELLQNDNGFLLQVESASPDKADHQADACGLIGEVGQLDEAVQAVQDWVDATGEETLIVATADHAHTAQITYAGANTAGRVTQLTTVEGSTMAVNFATAKSNRDEDALGGQEHTGSQLRVAASGPGAANVTGQIDQTDLFFLVNNALGIDGVNHGLTFENKMKPVEAKPEDTKPAEPKPEDTKPAEPKPEDTKPAGSAEGSSASNPLLTVILALSAVLGLVSLIALVFPFAVDSVLGPVAKF